MPQNRQRIVSFFVVITPRRGFVELNGSRNQSVKIGPDRRNKLFPWFKSDGIEAFEQKHPGFIQLNSQEQIRHLHRLRQLLERYFISPAGQLLQTLFKSVGFTLAVR